MTWVYSQSTRLIYHESEDGNLQILAAGSSGRGTQANCPASESFEFGPIPCGKYTFGQLISYNFMDDCLELIPDEDNQMFGRTSFMIHDGVSFGPQGVTSEGSICLPASARRQMAHFGDSTLLVVA